MTNVTQADLLILLLNLAVFALNLKLYTEWWKERVKKP